MRRAAPQRTQRGKAIMLAKQGIQSTGKLSHA